MLKKAIRMLDYNGSIHDLAKMSEVSAVTLYAINGNPKNKNITLPTLEKIYLGSKRLFGKGLLPSDYLVGVTFDFNHKKKNIKPNEEVAV
jgi:hypothetical protein